MDATDDAVDAEVATLLELKTRAKKAREEEKTEEMEETEEMEGLPSGDSRGDRSS